ncbi:hypothetical protein ONZ45_g12192 [Pleurotus djamor]|nr:hypothetical protein ONZ45_g12192 [Pleurotus djamor]
MFSQISRAFVFALLTFTLFAAATGPATTVTVTKTTIATQTIPASQCTTGDIQCCNSVQSSKSDAVGLILGLLGVVLGAVEVLVGLNCSVLGGSCNAQTVCCENNSFGGLIAIGCSPVNISL